MINLKLIAGEMASAIAQSRTKPKPGNIHRQVSVDPIAITPSGVSSKPPPTSALPISSQYSGNKSNRKFAKLRDLVNKDVEDQVITQITVRWSGEVFNVIVYWQANDEKLKINAFCFHGCVHNFTLYIYIYIYIKILLLIAGANKIYFLPFIQES